jgi:DNA polymerase V
MSNKHRFGLVDCNNFFVSCERVFRPDLRDVPLAILSNNDGCIVARSNEVKKLQIPMGAPFFKYQKILKQNGVQTLSSNYALYSDLSMRVMNTLSVLFREIQKYSIDEAFVLFDNTFHRDYSQFAHDAKNLVYQWTGVPVSVGIGKTKTLAKIATEIAKKEPRFRNSLNLDDLSETELDTYLEQLPVNDIWGVGYRSVEKLQSQGIYTAKDFKYAQSELIYALMKTTGYRTHLELQGTQCFEFSYLPQPQKSITCTRSFGRSILEFRELEEAVASYTSNAIERLRRQESTASRIYVFIHTNKYSKTEPYYYNGFEVKLEEPSFNTIVFVEAALKALKVIFIAGKSYKKAGVYIGDIQPINSLQPDMFVYDESKWEREEVLFDSIDRINRKWGKGTLKLGVEGFDRNWSMRRDLLSNRYTTNWNELPIVK